MVYDDVLTRNEDQELAVRVVSATEQATVVNPNDVYTRDTDGNLAIRTVGNGGGGSVNENKIIIKTAEMPVASASEFGKIRIFDGETTSTYTHGYIYECVGAGDPVVYSWERIDVQPSAKLGRYLSGWNCATGLATTNPQESPYEYTTGDYYIVGVVATGGASNYKPDGSSYTIGIASTTVESSSVAVNDTYLYDGTNWTLLKTGSAVTSVNGHIGDVVLDAEEVGAIPQYSTMPIASADYNGLIVQYTGATDSTYTNGYFYKCVSDGATPTPAYSWEQINIQPAPQITDVLEQWSSMPTAGADYLDKIVQYVGATGGGLTNGYVYKCTTDGSTYTWSQYNVQPTPVRSVNGMTGDVMLSTYLTYPAGWPTGANSTTAQFCAAIASDTTAVVGRAYLGEVTLSDLPASLSNGEIIVEIMSGTTASDKVIVLTLTSDNQSPYMWKYTYWDNGTHVSGWIGFQPELVSGTNIKTLNNVSLLGSGNISIDVSQFASVPTASADYANRIIQYTGATDSNYTNGYFYKCVSDGQTPATYSWARVDVQPNAVTSVNGHTGAVSLSPSDIGATSMDVPSTMPTLVVANWSNNSQTVQVSGVTATNTVFVAPAPASADDWATNGILCVAQGAGSLTFSCDSVPSTAITANVVIFN